MRVSKTATVVIHYTFKNLKCHFSTIHQNIRDLNTNLRQGYLTCLSHGFSVLPFTKTWLKPDTYSLELFRACVHVFRKDRSNKIDGGVLIAASSVFLSYHFDSSASFDIEFIVVRAIVAQRNIFITWSSIAPNSHIRAYKNVSYLFVKFWIE